MQHEIFTKSQEYGNTKKLGLAIIQLRRTSGISQEDFSKKANIDRCYMSSIENGKRQISIKIIEKIAVALNVSISKLFQEAEKF